MLGGGTEDRPEVEAAEDVADGEQTDDHAEVADPGDEEGLLARGGRRGAEEVERDQQVGAEAHQLPPGVHHEEVAGEHEEQHREDEEVEVGKEPALVLVVGHVPDGVPMDQAAHAGHDEDHDHRQRVDAEVDGDPEVPGCHPPEEVPDDETLLAGELREARQDGEGDGEGRRDEHGRQVPGHLRQPLAE